MRYEPPTHMRTTKYGGKQKSSQNSQNRDVKCPTAAEIHVHHHRQSKQRNHIPESNDLRLLEYCAADKPQDDAKKTQHHGRKPYPIGPS